MDNTDLAALKTALAALCRAERRIPSRRTARALETAWTPSVLPPHPPGPFDAAIRATLSTSDSPAARAVLAAMPHLPWGFNPVRGAEAYDGRIFSVCTLLGPEGPLFAQDVRLGLFWQAPDAYYPLHNHEADETYTILAGSALWTAGQRTRMRGAGERIHHPGLMPHAFRAGPTGFLALWRWSGDIDTRSYAILPDPVLLTA